METKFEDYKKLNEASATIKISAGRLIQGLQQAVYDAADQLGLEVDIKRFPGVLDIDYRIKMTGDEDKIRRMERWLRSLEAYNL